jgi:hypothetical protein
MLKLRFFADEATLEIISVVASANAAEYNSPSQPLQ